MFSRISKFFGLWWTPLINFKQQYQSYLCLYWIFDTGKTQRLTTGCLWVNKVCMCVRLMSRVSFCAADLWSAKLCLFGTLYQDRMFYPSQITSWCQGIYWLWKILKHKILRGQIKWNSEFLLTIIFIFKVSLVTCRYVAREKKDSSGIQFNSLSIWSKFAPTTRLNRQKLESRSLDNSCQMSRKHRRQRLRQL